MESPETDVTVCVYVTQIKNNVFQVLKPQINYSKPMSLEHCATKKKNTVQP